MPTTDTIAAIATPAGKGGIGIVRVSGAATRVIAEQLLRHLPPARYAHFGCFYDQDGDVIDQGVALWFPAPASFTGEDVLELHAHGSPVVLDLLLERIVALGARLAEPGEFSRRAFENDKYDLLQLEAIADLINSGSRQAAQSAQRSLQGVFSERVTDLLNQMTELRVLAEASIDFSDEDIEQLQGGEVQTRLAELERALDGLHTAAQNGAKLSAGAEVVITGRPNAGKSSLLNRLAGSDEAIVSAAVGTTRDIIKCDLVLDGLTLRVSDTAGLCEPRDDIEAEGIKRAYTAMHAADLVAVLADGTVGAGELERRLIAELDNAGVAYLLVINKVDLPEVSHREDGRLPGLPVSAKTGEGIAELIKAISNRLGVSESVESAVLARRRHLDALAEVCAAVARARLHQPAALELIAEELRQAHAALATLTGEFTTEDLLGEIFSQFCIGK